MNNYSIVEFIEESTVEIIPSSWVLSDNKTALWPRGIIPSILKKYLKSRTAPNADWSSVKIRILAQADTLTNAEKKAQKAEETSHLSSDSEPEIFLPSKRQKKKPNRFGTIYSDEEISKGPLTKNIQNNCETEEEDSPTPPVVQPFPESQDSAIIQTNGETATIKESTNCKEIKERILTKIFTVIEEIKFEMAIIKKDQQEIKGKIDALLTANDNININKFSRLLPITCIESFNEIDDSLANSQEDFTSLIKYLNLASGETVNQMVPSVMKLLMKKAVSIQFSGCGKKKKRDFSATKISAAVFDIVSRKLPNATKDQIFKRISKFLAESGDREGGRKERLLAEGSRDREGGRKGRSFVENGDKEGEREESSNSTN